LEVLCAKRNKLLADGTEELYTNKMRGILFARALINAGGFYDSIRARTRGFGLTKMKNPGQDPEGFWNKPGGLPHRL
jgi:hypothetical protein